MNSQKDTNNIRRFEAIGERDLQAYVDGQLDAQRTRAVENYLARHPEMAEQVRGDLACNRMLRDAVPAYEDAEIPPRLMAALNRPEERPVFRHMAQAAAVIALCLFSATGGWLAGINSDRPDATQQAQLAKSGSSQAGQPDGNPPVRTSVSLKNKQESGSKQANIGNSADTSADKAGNLQGTPDIIYPQQVIPDTNAIAPDRAGPRTRQQ